MNMLLMEAMNMAVLKAAREAGKDTGGWMPPDGRDEAAAIDSTYGLLPSQEERSEHAPEVRWSQCTKWNVRDADATLVLVQRWSQGSAFG
ncbi:MAG: putative molybdenum carrier protein [Cyclobacteriaceae bacterium]